MSEPTDKGTNAFPADNGGESISPIPTQTPSEHQATPHHPMPGPSRGDPTWVPPALTREEKTRNVGKTPVFFGPPLAILTDGQKNTMEISGKLNRTAERYLEIQRRHGLALTEAERLCIAHICHIGFMSPLEITELAFEVRMTAFQHDDLDKEALAKKLDSASFADLVVVVESLGF